MRYFYVSAIDGRRHHIVAGPYETHEAALAQVDAVWDYADQHDGRAHFMAWGTAGADTVMRTPLGAGWAPV